MARKKKGQLPSGNVRIQRIVGHTRDGKPIRKSFTGATKADAEYLYREYMLNPPKEKTGTLTLCEAVSRYIDMKAGVLSPSTIRGYTGLLRTHIEGSEIGGIDLEDLTAKDLQLWISDLSRDRTPKTVRNASALVRSSIEMFNPDFRYRVTLPQPQRPDLYCPSDDDVRQLLSCIEDRDLRIAVLLAAFGPLRRSEICALTSDDIDGSWITVNKAVVQNEIGEWVVKGTKTVGSIRRIQMPDFVVKELNGIQGPVITCSPSALSSRFVKALEESGCPKFRFHDLRHYSASIMHAIGVPDQYIMSRGGWSTDNVMKRVYRNVIDLEEAKQTRKITEHFSTLAK